ncbi:hypothetical protein Dimus_039346 [Dionaea muscipula]
MKDAKISGEMLEQIICGCPCTHLHSNPYITTTRTPPKTQTHEPMYSKTNYNKTSNRQKEMKPWQPKHLNTSTRITQPSQDPNHAKPQPSKHEEPSAGHADTVIDPKQPTNSTTTKTNTSCKRDLRWRNRQGRSK